MYLRNTFMEQFDDNGVLVGPFESLEQVNQFIKTTGDEWREARDAIYTPEEYLAEFETHGEEE